MPKFVTKTIKTVKGKQQFRQLVIVDEAEDTTKLQEKIDNQEVEAEGMLDLYEKSLETTYKSSFNAIITRMNLVANLHSLPETKFKDVTPEGELVKEYEFKDGALRVFAIKIPNGKLVILGGYKNNQKGDFARFRSLKKQYLESLNK